MELRSLVSVSVESSALMVSLIICGFLCLQNRKKEVDKEILTLIFLTLVVLCADIIAYVFRGDTSQLGWFMVPVSNAMVYITNYWIMLSYGKCLFNYAPKTPLFKKFKFIIFTMVYLSIAMLVAAQFGDWLYYFDGLNLYHRGRLFFLTQIAPIAGGFIFLWILMLNRKNLNVNVFVASLIYLGMPLIASIFQLFVYGFPVQTLAAVFGCWCMFFARELEVRDQLEEAMEAAKQANKAKTDFLFNMSHDIRTPMNALLGYAHLMKKGLSDPKMLDYQNKIVQSGDILLSIINNVLDMARIESGNTEISETYVALSDIPKEIMNVFIEEANKKDIELAYDIRIQDKYIVCDLTKVKEIYVNIVSNAIKYTNAGGKISAVIEELPCEEEDYAYFRTSISDTGIGMSEEFLPHIFDPFSRENNTTTSKISGTGLGMSIVKKLVDLLGGTIEVESELNKGSTFTVTLKHRICDEETYQKANNKTEIVINKNIFSGKRILLAEDNELNAEIAITILEDCGFIVEHALNGEECLKMYQHNDYDLILMDIQMPITNGYETTKKIREMTDFKKADIPIVAMTANAFEEDVKNAIEAGMNGHIAKPVDVNELMSVLAEVLNTPN
ncbi:MAG: ATP-binding protein [Erysipelotrichaceae bacterium]|nr:ATP-binding protein [Erysipelotrichaceae bacterium]